MEEASRISDKMIEEVVAPLLKVKNCVVVGISTNMGKDNWFSYLFEEKSEILEKVFIRKQLNLLCELCGTDESKVMSCKHNDWKHPNWNLPQNAKFSQVTK